MLRPKTKIVKTPFLGVNKEIDVLQLNEQYFVDCRNLDFTLKGITKRSGYTFFCNQDSNDPIIRLANYYFGTGYYLIGFTKTKLKKYNATTNLFEQVGTGSYSSTTYLCYDTGFNAIFFTNNIDRVKYWRYDLTNFADVPGLTDAEPGGVNVSRAYTLATFENFLVLANTLENGSFYPTRVRWSRYGDYTLWKNNADGTGMAGYFDLNAEASPVVALIPLGNLLFAFKPDNVYAIKFVGTPEVFITEKVLEDIGLVAPFAYTFYLNYLVFVGPDNIYFFNGSSITPIGDPVKSYFFNKLNYNRLNAVRMFALPQEHLIFVFYPTAYSDDDYCLEALVYNTELKSWTIYDIKMNDMINCSKSSDWTWDTTAQQWDNITRSWDEAQTSGGIYTIFASPVGKVFALEKGANDVEFEFEYYCNSKHYHFDNLLQVKRLLEIDLIGHNLENLQVKVLYGDNPLYLPYYQVFDVPQDDYKIQCDISAKFFKFEFILKDRTKNFNLISYYLRFLERGLR